MRFTEFGVDVVELQEMEGLLADVRREIIGKGFQLMPWLRDVAKRLNLCDTDIEALTGFVGLRVYLKRPSYHQAIRYLGLYRAGDRRFKRCDGKARRYLAMLTTTIIRREEGSFPPRLRDFWRTLRRLINLTKEPEPAGV